MSHEPNGNGHDQQQEVSSIELAATLKELVEVTGKNVAALKSVKDDLATRDGAIMAEFGVIHRDIDHVRALAETGLVRLARIDNEREVTVDDVRKLRKQYHPLSIQLADLDKRQAVEAAATRATLEAMKEKDEDLAGEITGQRTITDEMRADALRAARGSQAGVEVAAIEEKRETRTFRRQVTLWALGLVGAATMLVLTAYLGARFHVALSEPRLPDATHSEGH